MQALDPHKPDNIYIKNNIQRGILVHASNIACSRVDLLCYFSIVWLSTNQQSISLFGTHPRQTSRVIRIGGSMPQILARISPS